MKSAQLARKSLQDALLPGALDSAVTLDNLRLDFTGLLVQQDAVILFAR